MQIERIRETEPEAALPVLGPLVGTTSIAVTDRLGAVGRDATALIASLRDRAQGAARLTIAELLLAKEERRALRDLQASKELADFELQQWDKAFAERQREAIRELAAAPMAQVRGTARAIGLQGYSSLSKSELVEKISMYL